MCRHVGTCRDVEGDSSMLHHDLRSLPRRYLTAGQRKVKSCEQFDSRGTQLAQINSRIWLSAELDSLDYPLFEGGHLISRNIMYSQCHVFTSSLYFQQLQLIVCPNKLPFADPFRTSGAAAREDDIREILALYKHLLSRS